ncbi:hypothetical protein [Janibacter limosus]|uniref:hypothetical protein n=1 Tax=Janibacter limosus TaxID=53458 RepID=UPI000B021D72|nr:hypothetical protein [Janibacter limosus]
MRRLGDDNPYESPKVSLLSGIAPTTPGWSTMAQHGTRTDARGRSHTAAFRRSFLAAFAHRISERLSEVADAEVATVVGERRVSDSGSESLSGSGVELVPLLEERREAVDDAVDQHFPYLRMKRASAVTDGEGWISGRAAVDRASLGGGQPVEGR